MPDRNCHHSDEVTTRLNRARDKAHPHHCPREGYGNRQPENRPFVHRVTERKASVTGGSRQRSTTASSARRAASRWLRALGPIHSQPVIFLRPRRGHSTATALPPENSIVCSSLVESAKCCSRLWLFALISLTVFSQKSLWWPQSQRYEDGMRCTAIPEISLPTAARMSRSNLPPHPPSSNAKV